MAKGDSMYDHARSEKEGDKGGGKKVTETKKVTEEKPAEKKAEEPEEKEVDGAKAAPEQVAAGEAAAPAGSAMDGEGAKNQMQEMMDGMKKLRAAHEAEHRDLHGNHREAMRQMAARHGKALKDHLDFHMEKMGGADSAPEAAGQVPAGTPGTEAAKE